MAFVPQMFGSLFGVAKALPETRQQLTENWYKIIRRWYPDLHQKVYCAPPVHFRALSFKPKPVKPVEPVEPFERFGMRMYLPTQYSTTKDDEAQQRMLWTLSTFARNRGDHAFILSNMDFQNYLNKDYEWPDNIEQPLKPDIRTSSEEGEIDILIIDKVHGLFVLEVKSCGDPDDARTCGEKEQLSVILVIILYRAIFVVFLIFMKYESV